MKALVISVLALGLVVSAAPTPAQVEESGLKDMFDPPLLDNGRMNSYPSEPATYGITFRKNWD